MANHGSAPWKNDRMLKMPAKTEKWRGKQQSACTRGGAGARALGLFCACFELTLSLLCAYLAMNQSNWLASVARWLRTA